MVEMKSANVGKYIGGRILLPYVLMKADVDVVNTEIM